MRRGQRRRRRYGPRLLEALLTRPAAGGKRRRRRYRVVNRRRLLLAQAALAVIAAVAVALSVSVIVRSVRTARLNRSLVAIHTISGDAMEAQIAAPPLEAAVTAAQSRSAAPYGELSAMVMPDGSPISAPATVETVERFRRTDLDILPDMMELVRRNQDTVGWLSIGGVVRLPVVYRDNTYYLNHDFLGGDNASGTLFLDENTPLTETAQNLVIHGHSMNDGSMFGILTHYRKLGFLKQHPLISFSTLWEKETYAIFAVLLVSSDASDENYFNYFSNSEFVSDGEFNVYVKQLKDRSLRKIPVEAQPTDALLTLSTCIDDDRLVVVARRLRSGETKDELTSAVESSY